MSPIGYIILTLALIAAICLGTAAVEAWCRWRNDKDFDKRYGTDWRKAQDTDHV